MAKRVLRTILSIVLAIFVSINFAYILVISSCFTSFNVIEYLFDGLPHLQAYGIGYDEYVLKYNNKKYFAYEDFYLSVDSGFLKDQPMTKVAYYKDFFYWYPGRISVLNSDPDKKFLYVDCLQKGDYSIRVEHFVREDVYNDLMDTPILKIGYADNYIYLEEDITFMDLLEDPIKDNNETQDSTGDRIYFEVNICVKENYGCADLIWIGSNLVYREGRYETTIIDTKNETVNRVVIKSEYNYLFEQFKE